MLLPVIGLFYLLNVSHTIDPLNWKANLKLDITNHITASECSLCPLCKGAQTFDEATNIKDSTQLAALNYIVLMGAIKTLLGM